jgi:hypothetical protein
MTILQKILRFVRLNQGYNAEINQIVSKGIHSDAGNYFILYTGSSYEIIKNIPQDEFDKFKLNDIYNVWGFEF